MKIIKASAELMKHDTDLYSFIERVGRTCYKSEDKIAEGAAKKFVKGLADNHHLAMLEHEYFYFQFEKFEDILHVMTRCMVPDSYSYHLTKYLHISEFFISGSVRAWIEFFDNIHKISQKYVIGRGIYKTMHWLLNTKYPDLFPLYSDWNYEEDEEDDGEDNGIIGLLDRKSFIQDCKELYDDPDKVFYHLLPHTIKFVADRGFLAEITRHRPASFAAESTRYCCYSHDKFGEEITVIEPCFWEKDSAHYLMWEKSCQESEDTYIAMTKNQAKAEEARSILPNSLKTEVVVTATEEEWQHILNLRYHGITGRPHPQMSEVMELAYPILVNESEGRLK